MSDDRVGGGTKRDKIIVTIVGLIAAPVVGGVVGTTCLAVYSVIANEGGHVRDMKTFLMIFSMVISGPWIGLLYGVAPALLIGWPVHTYLVRAGRNGLITYALGGAIIGFVGIAIMMPLLLGLDLIQTLLIYPVTGLILVAVGASAGLVFWLIRRPDRDASPATPIPPTTSPSA